MKTKRYMCGCWACTDSAEKKAIARDKEARYYRDRINNYLASGGLVNPELMEHAKVRDLLMELGNYLEDRS